jgi:hypothetical protein
MLRGYYKKTLDDFSFLAFDEWQTGKEKLNRGIILGSKSVEEQPRTRLQKIERSC